MKGLRIEEGKCAATRKLLAKELLQLQQQQQQQHPRLQGVGNQLWPHLLQLPNEFLQLLSLARH